MKIYPLVLCSIMLLGFIAGAAAEENIDYTGRISFDLNNIPALNDFSVSISDDVKIAEDILWDTHPHAWSFRTRLREGLKSGPNFADKYAVIGHGCGTSCQIYWVVNVETGKVLGRFSSTYGAHFRRDSRLIIRNASDDFQMTSEEYPLLGIVDYYKVWNDELILIKRLKLSDLYGADD
ncbi:MAG: hypothetical protein ACTHOO_12575 [Alcanivorax sp.]